MFLVPKETRVTLEPLELLVFLVPKETRVTLENQDHREVWGQKERKVYEDRQQLLWVELRITGGDTRTVALECNVCILEGLEVLLVVIKVALPTTCACLMTHNTHNTKLECVVIATCMELNMKNLLCLVALNTMLHVLYATFLQNTQLL